MRVFVSETKICKVTVLQQKPVSPPSKVLGLTGWRLYPRVSVGFLISGCYVLFGKGQVDRVRGGKVGGETSNTTKNGGLAFGGACRSAVVLSGGLRGTPQAPAASS